MAELDPPSASMPYALLRASGETSPLDLDPEGVVELYKKHGALLLRGFGTDLESFRRFAQQFCISSAFNDSRGRNLLDPTHNIQSVNRGVAPFPLHPELSREPWRPDVCFFGCLNPPLREGATTVCDGVEIVGHLPDGVRRAFERRRLLYMQTALPEELAYWLGTARPTDAQLASPPPHSPYFFGRGHGRIVRAFTRPALHRPMFCDAPAFGNFILFARYLRGMTDFPLFEDGSMIPAVLVEAVKQVSDRLTAAVAWQQGDLLMLDNSRFMHGRTAVQDPDNRLIASYFDYLKFAPPQPEEPADPVWRRGDFIPPGSVTAAEKAA